MGDRHLKFHELRDNLRAPLVHTYCPLSEVKVQVAASRIRRRSTCEPTQVQGNAGARQTDRCGADDRFKSHYVHGRGASAVPTAARPGATVALVARLEGSRQEVALCHDDYASDDTPGTPPSSLTEHSDA